MIKHLAILLAFLMTLSSPVAAQDYTEGLAAYNAGPHRVNEWLNLRPLTDDWAHWVATIPYKETRRYVQNIMASSKVYEAKLNNNQVAMVNHPIIEK